MVKENKKNYFKAFYVILYRWFINIGEMELTLYH